MDGYPKKIPVTEIDMEKVIKIANYNFDMIWGLLQTLEKSVVENAELVQDVNKLKTQVFG